MGRELTYDMLEMLGEPSTCNEINAMTRFWFGHDYYARYTSTALLRLRKWGYITFDKTKRKGQRKYRIIKPYTDRAEKIVIRIDDLET